MLTLSLLLGALQAGRPGALDPTWHAGTVRCSRATKAALRQGGGLRIIEPASSAALAKAEALVADAYGAMREEQPARESDDWATANARAAAEFQTLFSTHQYSMAGADLPPALAASLVLGPLALSADDALLDLGSSSGVLCLVAAALSPAARVCGVELSPSRHAKALAARDALGLTHPAAASRLELRNGDLLDAVLGDFSVLFCAVQPAAAVKLMPALLSKLRAAHAARAKGGICADGSTSVSVRLFCAGFGVPDVEGVRATLVCGHAFAPPPETDAEREAGATRIASPMRAVPLYGARGEGPRVILEYALTLSIGSAQD
jgi:predicted O-methyltransferase YrrM